MFKLKTLALSALFLMGCIQAQAEDPRVEVDTTHGTFILQLDAENAPISTANFIQYVKDGHYTETAFHRVIAGFMAQGGGYDLDLQQKETRDPIENESKNGLSNLRGTISMARTNQPHSASAQFFINLVDNARLDGTEYTWGYAVFGKVVEGMEVLDDIAKIPTGPGPEGTFRSDVPQSAAFVKTMKVID
ncbi:MAG: peptidylprolyl isomerase [Pseudomonadota bacterium]